ncbi:MAG: DUF4388 domain-containing protein [Thermodesulfobacteriota bacterium]
MTPDLNTIAVANSDKDERRGLIEYLTGEGHTCVGVCDGAAAIETALRTAPGIIILDIDIPIIDAEQVYRILRNNPNTKDVSFLFITGRVVDIKDFRIDADALIQRPIKLEELHGIVNKQFLRLKKINGVSGSRERGKEIEGNLSHMSLPDILQMLQANRKEGVIKVISGVLKGTIDIKGGEIYNAVLGDTEKEKALFRLLQWREGSFEFVPLPITISRKIFDTIHNLLIEGARHQDELTKGADDFPAPDSLLTLTVDIKALPKRLKPNIHEVLSLVEYYPRVADLVDHSFLPDLEVYQALVKVLERGLLKEDKEEREAIETPLTALLNSPKAIQIREKTLNRWSDMASVNYGKVLIASTGGSLMPQFLLNCKALPSFSINRQLLTSRVYKENPFGVLGRLMLYGGMEILLYALPTEEGMGPLWEAFSKNGIGLFLIWGGESIDHLQRLASMKETLLTNRRIPVMHVCIGKKPLGKKNETKARKILGMKRNEQIFTLDREKPKKVHDLFFTYFGELMREDYVSP